MSRKEALIVFTQEIVIVLGEIEQQADVDHRQNASDGRMEFVYVQYYLVEIRNLLDLSMYLLTHNTFRKYTHFPIRQIMEIVLYLEDMYSIKKEEGLDGVRRLFFRDIASVAKSQLELPGEGGKEKIRNQLGLLDVASKILNLDFKTENVSSKSRRNIKNLCEKSTVIVKKCTGGELYNFYSILSEPSHANVVNIGASNSTNDETEALMIFEIGIELTLRFCEMIVRESGYVKIVPDIENLKRTAGI
mgnify:CR=1 FL=1